MMELLFRIIEKKKCKERKKYCLPEFFLFSKCFKKPPCQGHLNSRLFAEVLRYSPSLNIFFNPSDKRCKHSVTWMYTTGHQTLAFDKKFR